MWTSLRPGPGLLSPQRGRRFWALVLGGAAALFLLGFLGGTGGVGAGLREACSGLWAGEAPLPLSALLLLSFFERKAAAGLVSQTAHGDEATKLLRQGQDGQMQQLAGLEQGGTRAGRTRFWSLCLGSCQVALLAALVPLLHPGKLGSYGWVEDGLHKDEPASGWGLDSVACVGPSQVCFSASPAVPYAQAGEPAQAWVSGFKKSVDGGNLPPPRMFKNASIHVWRSYPIYCGLGYWKASIIFSSYEKALAMFCGCQSAPAACVLPSFVLSAF